MGAFILFIYLFILHVFPWQHGINFALTAFSIKMYVFIYPSLLILRTYIVDMHNFCIYVAVIFSNISPDELFYGRS